MFFQSVGGKITSLSLPPIVFKNYWPFQYGTSVMVLCVSCYSFQFRCCLHLLCVQIIISLVEAAG